MMMRRSGRRVMQRSNAETEMTEREREFHVS
jgi:hypothetical protein